MMSFLLFLLVFIITYNNGTARPMLDSDFNVVTRNGLDEDSSDEMLYKMPTIIKLGMSISINGILDTTSQMFKVALIDSDNGKEDCNITLDYASNTLNVIPSIQHYETAPYDLNLQDGVEPKFLIRLIARVDDYGKQMVAVYFAVNDEGESDQLICDISFENIGYIEMQQGVASVDGLKFRFNENR